MHLHLTTFQLFAAGFALVFVAILAVTEFLEHLRKDRPLFVGRPVSELERVRARRSFSSEPDEEHTWN